MDIKLKIVLPSLKQNPNEYQKKMVSILVPTYNESKNIKILLDSIIRNLPNQIHSEIIIIDDNSPDGTAKISDEYIKNSRKNSIRIIKRKLKSGLSSAITTGIKFSLGDYIVIMDSDLSHPPKLIPEMIKKLEQSDNDLVIASRYEDGGEINGWPLKRRLQSLGATKLAKLILRIKVKDPMSGFFAFKRNIIKGIKFDAIGYKILLEVLVKTKGIKVTEIPYSFTDRKFGSSKLDLSVQIDFLKSLWRLYRYGQKTIQEERKSIKFLSKAIRFYTVGASGIGVNYLASLLFSFGFTQFWYLHANLIGIFISMGTNFFLNKFWTFEDRNYDLTRTFSQMGMFFAFSSVGALIQLGMVFYLVDSLNIEYPVALILAVLTAASGNFIFNKKWTFKEKVWG